MRSMSPIASTGRRGRLLMRSEEPLLSATTAAKQVAVDGDGALFRLAAEASRIRLAYLFDPYLAVHAWRNKALPRQVTTVYGG